MEKYILALDAGTTSHRAMLIAHDGSLQSIDQLEFEQIYPAPGLVEHNPSVIFNDQLTVAKKAIEKAGIGAEQIAGIGITNQRETVIAWHRETGQPIGNAIVWQDRRTAERCRQLLAEGLEARIREKTGLVIDAYFSATKMEWLMRSSEKCRHLARAGKLAFGTVDSWLLWNFTGGRVHATDITNASRTMLYDIHKKRWDPDLLRLFGIPEQLLPTVMPCSTLYGMTDKKHFGAEIPICGMAGDQQAALFGQMCTEPGMVKNTYGTGCFVIMQTGEKAVQSQNKLLTTIAWELDGTVHYALEGSVFVTGALVQWLRDNLGIIGSAPEIEALANTVPDNGDVYIVPAFTGLGAPHWDPYARGAMMGLTRGTSKGHIARAALESIALQSVDVLETMERDAGIRLVELRVDGGASQNNTLMQIQADLMDIRVKRPLNTETTAMGAAFLAGLYTGYWDGLKDLRKSWSPERTFVPNMDKDKKQAIRTRWQQAVRRCGRWGKLD